MTAPANTGTLGWVYVGLTAAWTVILAGGMVFLHRHRKLPFLQIRRLPLLFTAVILLHLYGTACMIAWIIGPMIPCDGQFWVMSIYLPFGMALLQAANSQFLHVAGQQKKFARFGNLNDETMYEKATSTEVDPSLSWPQRIVKKVWKADKTDRILVFICIGMAVELALTFFVYFGSEMFHPSYGIFNLKVPGTEERKVLCFEGWEWWLSIVWQFFWAWIYAPYLLWKSRNIHDTHGWRLQTIVCSIAGLPPSPLWLAGLYIPQMAPVNAVLNPPQWFSISIFFIEIAVIFIPVWQVLKSRKLKNETLEAIAQWEHRKNRMTTDLESIMDNSAALSNLQTLLGGSIAGKSDLTGKTKATEASSSSSSSTRKSDLFTMQALENALRSNPLPLLEYAALKDFSGENISFLTHVAEWKKLWALSDRHDQFIHAVRIYSHFVSLDYADFPINVSSNAAKGLRELFGVAAMLLNRRPSLQSDSATPFDEVAPTESTEELRGGEGKNGPDRLESRLGKANLTSATRMSALTRDGRPDVPIPVVFGPQVFDAAEIEIKYLVLTNTWPKFVHARFEAGPKSVTECGQQQHHKFQFQIGHLVCGWRSDV